MDEAAKTQAEIIAYLAERGIKVQQPSLSRWLKRNRGGASKAPTHQRQAAEAAKAIIPEVVDKSNHLAMIRDWFMDLSRDPDTTLSQVKAAEGAAKAEVARMYLDP